MPLVCSYQIITDILIDKIFLPYYRYVPLYFIALTKQLQSQRTFCTWFSRTRFDMNKPKRKCSLLLEVAIPNIPEIKIRLAIKVTGKWMD